MIAATLSLLLALQAPAPPGGWTAFVRSFDAYAAQDDIVGASVLVMQDGHITARHDVGWADRSARLPVDSSTIFHWASITKTLTAVAIMQMRDRHRLGLDDRITSYIPTLRQIHDPFGSMDDITLAMLLSHSSGLQDPTWPYTQGKAWEPFEPTRWEQLVSMMPYQELLFPPGTTYSYSNPAFIYLARVLEHLTGDAWQTYIYKNLFGPLDIRRSYFGVTPYYLAAHRSDNYYVVGDSTGRDSVVSNGRDFDPGITIPNGGWNAPLGDLAIWARFLTGTVDRDTTAARRYDVVLARSSLQEMWRARLPTPDAGGDLAESPDSVGLSFFILWRHGVRFVGHTGSQAGFRSFLYIDPVRRSAVIAAFNTSNMARPDESSRGFLALRDSALAMLARR
jgi:CubicO group peptidase (beta-lactamase class C family)